MVKCKTGALNLTFSALADPTRRNILDHLSRGECCVTDLAKPYAMSLPAVSKHLRVLEDAGLICRHRQGRIHSISLKAGPLQEAQAWMESYRRHWEVSFDRLDDFLIQLQTPPT
ncbi:DNA-binding transcriptional ArsR family regulator [Prosthecobacter dejongeii]|uniref:DNA-binding transcriptional ArsR family regulator n=2 Tax=Prosthecobacter dejongeii TaxID=48465 RepID=A0A7W7YLJ4_9BACT|nr:metalloregulator ArsR/SmtB family transcription factor [Prosthecobacter dejongeii]MBB5038160.1 DNA-binding transcriptional ArsR family regulator [Prosthecobacter dejongeii]